MSKENIRFFEEFDFPNYDDWKNAAISALKGAPFDKVMFTDTYEGIKLKPIYNKEDLLTAKHISQEFPGFYPFNRGGDADGYKVSSFEICQNIPYPIAKDYNTALKYDLTRGQNSIKINIEKATAIHEDFTAEDLSGSEVCIATSDDMKAAFKDINLSDYPVNIDAGIGAFTAFTSLISAIDDDKYKDLNGTLNFDFITEFAKEGKLVADLSRYIEEMYAIAKWSNANSPNFRTIGISGCEWHNAGANAVQELTVSIGLGIFYIRELLKKNLTIDEIAPKISFSLSIGINFFMEIAKFRAIRIIWSRVIKEFGGSEESQKAHIHAITSEREHTKLDPYVNILRATSQVFSAVTGNCDSITVNNFDKEFGMPSEFSRRIARNAQNVIKFESHLDDTIDPAGGSYYIENLTSELINSAWNEYIEIEKNGGILEQLKSGTIQTKVEDNFKKRLENIAFRKDIIVGVNKYANINEKPVETTLGYDIDTMNNFVENFDAFINSRELSKVDDLLDEFEVKFKVNSYESIAIAVKALQSGASLGELYNSIPTFISETIDIAPIYLRRSSEIFENLRDIMSEYISDNETKPILDFVCFGALRDWKARADFANDFFSVGGFANIIHDGFNSAHDAISKINFSEKKIIVVCSTDDKYSELLIDLAKNIKSANADNYIILAGYPKDMVQAYKGAGVDMFIHIKANITECLNEVYKIAGLIK
jgi:methylmalonyl-CoA mutase